MGLLTDVLVAAPSEAEAICKVSRHWEKWPCLQWKGADNQVFAELVTALGAEADAQALEQGDRLIYMENEEGPWVFHLPDVIPRTLSTLEDGDMPGLAGRWLQGEETRDYLGMHVGVLVAALKDLRDLSRQAVAADKSLLLWVSL
jgi:hypothetical protein